MYVFRAAFLKKCSASNSNPNSKTPSLYKTTFLISRNSHPTKNSRVVGVGPLVASGFGNPPTGFNGLAGRTGGAVDPLVDITEAGGGPAPTDVIRTKFSGKSPFLPFNSPKYQPSSEHFRFRTVITSPSFRSSSSGLLAVYP